MPIVAYASITANGTLITENVNTESSMGNSYQEDHTDEITVQSFRHGVTVPCDITSGQTTARRVHKPYVIIKAFDKASPMIAHALALGQLCTVVVKFYRTTMTGTQEHFYTHRLDDALVVDIQSYMPSANDPATAHLMNVEEVSFAYRQITTTHELSSVEFSDNWRATRPRF